MGFSANPQLGDIINIHYCDKSGIDILFRCTELPHHFRTIPPFGACNVKKININDNTVPEKFASASTSKDINPQLQHQARKKKNTRILTTIQRRARNIIKFAPPREVLLADPILEYETNGKPTRVVDTGRRWDV